LTSTGRTDVPRKINPEDAERHLHSTRDLLQEIHIMRQINHPCLVKLVGANLDITKHQPFLLTEFLEHKDVETLVQGSIKFYKVFEHCAFMFIYFHLFSTFSTLGLCHLVSFVVWLWCVLHGLGLGSLRL